MDRAANGRWANRGGGRAVQPQGAHVCEAPLRSPHRRVRIAVAGVGGNGSRFLHGLPLLDLALRAHGRHGLEVVAYDPGRVTEANLVRQRFYRSDVGLNKAVVLIHRLNVSHGLEWEALPTAAGADALGHASRVTGYHGFDVVVGCVDTPSARAELARALTEPRCQVAYALDLGNERDYGQVVLGQPLNARNRRSRRRLPTAYELMPALVDEAAPADDAPSCSALESLTRQALFMNDSVAVCALNLLGRLLLEPSISYHGGFVNLETGVVQPIRVDAATWKQMRRRPRAPRRAPPGPPEGAARVS